MAPEVLRGEAISPACDVFSWGCLVAFAASGRAPFNGEALPAVIFQVLNAEPVLDNLEPQMRQLVLAALDKDPRNRPSAQQLLDSMVGRVTPEIAQHTVAQTWQQSAPPCVGARRTGGPPDRRGRGRGGGRDHGGHHRRTRPGRAERPAGEPGAPLSGGLHQQRRLARHLRPQQGLRLRLHPAGHLRTGPQHRQPRGRRPGADPVRRGAEGDPGPSPTPVTPSTSSSASSPRPRTRSAPANTACSAGAATTTTSPAATSSC